MGARVWIYLIVFHVIFVSVKANDTNAQKGKTNTTARNPNGKTVIAEDNAANLCYSREVKTTLYQIQKKLDDLAAKMSIPAYPG